MYCTIFTLPHFRVKMDAVPGLPTYFIFTPTKTTEEYRNELSNYPEWQGPADESDPQGPKKWQTFDYELACAELCGQGHYSMRRVVRIVSEAEYEQWLGTQQSYYMQNVRNTDADPNKDQLLNIEIQERTTELLSLVTLALQSEDDADNTIVLKHVFFETGETGLKNHSRFELNNIVQILRDNPDIRIELSGHTDSTGEEAQNLAISRERANSVQAYLLDKGIDASRVATTGYGSSRPIESNDTEEGRTLNRRTEMKIIAQ